MHKPGPKDARTQFTIAFTSEIRRQSNLLIPEQRRSAEGANAPEFTRGMFTISLELTNKARQQPGI